MILVVSVWYTYITFCLNTNVKYEKTLKTHIYKQHTVKNIHVGDVDCTLNLNL